MNARNKGAKIGIKQIKRNALNQPAWQYNLSSTSSTFSFDTLFLFFAKNIIDEWFR